MVPDSSAAGQTMLINFYSKVGGFTMFGDIAVKLLQMTGHSGAVPGAIRAEDLTGAVGRLSAAIEKAGSAPADEEAEQGEEGRPPVTLRQRAFPLIDLMKRSAAEDCDVLWKEG